MSGVPSVLGRPQPAQNGSVKEVVVWGGNREEVVGDIVQAVLAPLTLLMQ